MGILKSNVILVKRINRDEKFDNRLDKIKTLADEYNKEFLKSANSFKSGQKVEKVFTGNNRFVIVSRELQDLVPQMTDESENRMENEIKNAQKIRIDVIHTMVVGLIVSMVVVFLVIFFISKDFTITEYLTNMGYQFSSCKKRVKTYPNLQMQN